MLEGVFLLPERRQILWSSSLRTTAFTGWHQAVADFVQAPDPSSPVRELLERQGYWHCRESKRRDDLASALPEGCKLWPRFDFQAMTEWKSLQPTTHVFPGDGDGGAWLYTETPGESPCLECIVRRWLANRFLGEPVRELCRAGRSVVWPWHLDERELAQIQPPAPGTAKYLNDGRWTHTRPLPVPACRKRCQHAAPDATSLADPVFGLLPRLHPWRESAEPSNLPLWSAQPGEGEWLLDQPGAYVGTGAGENAREKAIGEALERYSSRFERSGLPALTGSALSHGLACHTCPEESTRRGRNELIERDATSIFWARLANGKPTGARRITDILWQLPATTGKVYLAVLDQDGRPACGSAFGDADKAKEEALHNQIFLNRNPGDRPPEGPANFEDHLRYYWHNPQQFPWERLRGIGKESVGKLPAAGHFENFDLTTPDVRILGYCVTRSVNPELVYLPASHDTWPIHLARYRRLVGAKKPALPHPFA